MGVGYVDGVSLTGTGVSPHELTRTYRRFALYPTKGACIATPPWIPQLFTDGTVPVLRSLLGSDSLFTKAELRKAQTRCIRIARCATTIPSD